MLRIFYSNRTEELLQALVENAVSHRSGDGATLFEPTHLVFPIRNIETYVKLSVARVTGIVANIEVRFLRDFIQDLASATSPESIVPDRTRLHDAIPTALLDDELLPLLGNPELPCSSSVIISVTAVSVRSEVCCAYIPLMSDTLY